MVTERGHTALRSLGRQVLINAGGRLDPATYPTKVTLSSSGAHGKAEYLLRLTAPMKHSHSGDLIVGWSALGKQQLLMHLATGAAGPGAGAGPSGSAAAATAEGAGAGAAAAARGRGGGGWTGPRSGAGNRPEALRAGSVEGPGDGEEEGAAGPGEAEPAAQGWRSVHGGPAVVGGEVAAGGHGLPQRGGIGYRMLPYDPYAALYGGERGTAEVRQWGPEGGGEGDEDAFPAPDELLLAAVPRRTRTARVRPPSGEPRGLTAWSSLADQIATAAATAAATDASALDRQEDSGQEPGLEAGTEGPLEVVEEEKEDGQGHSRRESLPDSVLNAAEQLLHLSAQPLASGDEVEQPGAGGNDRGHGDKAMREASSGGSPGAGGAAAAARAVELAGTEAKGAAVAAPAGSRLVGEGTPSGDEGGGSVGGAASGGGMPAGAAEGQVQVGSDGEGEGVGSAESGGHGAGGLWGQEQEEERLVRATAAPFSEDAGATQGPRPRLGSSGAQARGEASAAAAAAEPAVSSPLKRAPTLPELVPQAKVPELRGAALGDGRPTNGAPTPALTPNNHTDPGVSGPSATASIDLRAVQSHTAAPKQLGVDAGAAAGLGLHLQVLGARAEAARGAGGSDSDDAGSVRGHRQQRHAEAGAAATTASGAACEGDRPGLAAPLGAEGPRGLGGQGSAATGEGPGMAAGVASSAAAVFPLGAARAAGDASAEGNKGAVHDAAHGAAPAPTGPTDGKATEAGSWLSTATAAACGAHSGMHAPASRPPAGDLPASDTKANAAPEVAFTSPEHPLSPGDAGPIPPLHPPSLQLHANSTTASPVRVAAAPNLPAPEPVPLHTLAAIGTATLGSPQAAQPLAAVTGPYVHDGTADTKPAVAAGVALSGPRPSRGTDGETHYSTATGLEGARLAGMGPVTLAPAHSAQEQTHRPLPLQRLSPVVPLPGSVAAGYALPDAPASGTAPGTARPPGKGAAASGAFQPVAHGRQVSGGGMLPGADGSPVAAPPPGALWPFGPALPMPLPMPLQLQGLMQMGMGLGLGPAMAAMGGVPGMGLGALPMPMQPGFLVGFGYPDNKQQQQLQQLQMQMQQGEHGLGQAGGGAARKAGGKVAGEKRKSEPLGLMDRAPGAAAAPWAPLDPTLSPPAKRPSTGRAPGVPLRPTGAKPASPAPPSREGTPAARAASLGDARPHSDQQQQQQQQLLPPSWGTHHPPVLHPRSAFSFVPGALHPSPHAAGLPFLPMGMGGMHPMQMQLPLPYLAAVPDVAGPPHHSPQTAVAVAPVAAGVATAGPLVQQQHGNPGALARCLDSPGPVGALPAALGAAVGAAGMEAASGAGASSARTQLGAPISECGGGPAAEADT